jgi:acyl-coenzyme A synthetase/AMP-(fatty) acid ligase
VGGQWFASLRREKKGDGIAAVVESQAGVKLDEISLLRSLEKKLEHYAIPGRRILEIARMPRNENDKLDRKAVAAWLESQLQSD